MTFDLTEAIRRHLDESDEPDPHVIAQTVSDEVPDDETRAVMEQLMPHGVRNVIHHQRSYVRKQRSGLAESPGGSTSPTKSGATPPAGPPTNGKKDLGEFTRDPSRAREYSWLRKEWVFKDDFTVEDCEANAEHHRKLAAQNGVVAAEFEDFATRLRGAPDHVKTIGDLHKHEAGEAA